MALPDFLDHPVKETRRRVSISSETRLVYVQSIYVPGLWVWDGRHVQREFVVQYSVCQDSEILLVGFILVYFLY